MGVPAPKTDPLIWMSIFEEVYFDSNSPRISPPIMTDREIWQYGLIDAAKSFGQGVGFKIIDEIGGGYFQRFFVDGNIPVWLGNGIDRTDYGAEFFRYYKAPIKESVEYSTEAIARRVPKGLLREISENPLLARAFGRTGDVLFIPASIFLNYSPSLIENYYTNAPVENYVADFVIDTGGWALSTGGGMLAAVASLPLGVIASAGIGLSVDLGIGVAYDSFIESHQIREKFSSKLLNNFENNKLQGVPIYCPGGCPD